MTEDRRDPLTREIIGACIQVHRELGPGLLESIYLECVEFELAHRGIPFDRHRRVPLVYRGRTLDAYFEMDLVVRDRVVVELKTVECVMPVHSAQVISYLRLSGLPIGLLVNFREAILTRGVRRYANGAFVGSGISGV